MILITGGAGYIGSVVASLLLKKDKDIVIIDNLSTGDIETINRLKKIKDFLFIEADLANKDEIRGVFKSLKIDSIIHFAASISVPESVKDPLKYYKNNTINTINLVDLAVKFGVKKFIFSSTAAVYGEGKRVVKESDALNPFNPYGRSKLFSEWVIKDAFNAYGLKYVILRYFNVAGASDDLEFGQKEAKSLIKMVAKAAVEHSKVTIFGDDYPTKDGTGVRDYIHVMDLAIAHIKALDYLDQNDFGIFNVGYNRGYSVKEIIDTMKKVSGVDFEVEVGKRREGDIDMLIANNEEIINKMKWLPKYDDINLVCKSAYEWEKKIKK